MSWQAYVDTSLLGSGTLGQAAIYGLDGTTWASSSDLVSFNPVPLIDAYKDPSNLRSDGLTVNNTRYVVIRSDERSIYGKSKDQGGFIAVKTNQSLILGLYFSNHLAGESAKIVEELADYLLASGY